MVPTRSLFARLLLAAGTDMVRPLRTDVVLTFLPALLPRVLVFEVDLFLLLATFKQFLDFFSRLACFNMLGRVVVVWYLVLLDVHGKRDKDAVGMTTNRYCSANGSLPFRPARCWAHRRVPRRRKL